MTHEELEAQQRGTVSQSEYRQLQLVVSVLTSMQTKCKLSVAEAVRLSTQYNLVDFLASNYELFHIQGDLAILGYVKQYLERHGEQLYVPQ